MALNSGAGDEGACLARGFHYYNDFKVSSIVNYTDSKGMQSNQRKNCMPDWFEVGVCVPLMSGIKR